MSWKKDPTFGISIDEGLTKGEYISIPDNGTISSHGPINMTPCCPELDAYVENLKLELLDLVSEQVHRIHRSVPEIKAEITEHAEKEEDRLFMKYAWCSNHNPDVNAIKDEITEHAEKEIERIKSAKEVKKDCLRDLFNLYQKALMKAHREGVWDQEEYDAMFELVNKEMISHGY